MKLEALTLLRIDLIVLGCILVSFLSIVFYVIQKRLILRALFRWNARRQIQAMIDRAINVQQMNDAIDRFNSL